MRIYGGSDDLVELEDCDAADEFCTDAADEAVVALVIGYPEAKPGEDAHGLVVQMKYGTARDGVWEARLSQIGEDVPCRWPVAVTFEGYTSTVHIKCPDDTPVKVTIEKDGQP